MEKEYTPKYLQINRGKNIIFDAKAVPYFTVLPELSDLTENRNVADYFNQRYSSLVFSTASLVDGGIVIQNIPTADCQRAVKMAKELNQVSNITLQIVDPTEMTTNLIDLLENSETFSEESLLVFPGSGANDALLQLEKFNSSLLANDRVQLKTNRSLIQPGKFSLSVDYSNLPAKSYKNALIVDDVVASGQTASSIAFSLRSFYPNISVSIATWLMLPPENKKNQASASGISYIDQSYASIVLKGNYMQRPPINSLSMFLDTSDLSIEKQETYLNKYVQDKASYITMINNLRSLR